MTELVNLRSVLIDVAHPVFASAIIKAICEGWYEEHEAKICAEMLEDGDTVVEIGGGCGFLSSFIFKIKKNIQMVVFEANPTMIEVINYTHLLNDVKAVVFNEVLADRYGTTDFHVNKHFWASSERGFFKNETRISVPTVPWKEKISKLKPNFIIMDIEGGELDILKYEQYNFIKKYIIEFHPHIYGFEKTAELLRDLQDIGFLIKFISGNTLGFSRK